MRWASASASGSTWRHRVRRRAVQRSSGVATAARPTRACRAGRRAAAVAADGVGWSARRRRRSSSVVAVGLGLLVGHAVIVPHLSASSAIQTMSSRCSARRRRARR